MQIFLMKLWLSSIKSVPPFCKPSALTTVTGLPFYQLPECSLFAIVGIGWRDRCITAIKESPRWRTSVVVDETLSETVHGSADLLQKWRKWGKEGTKSCKALLTITVAWNLKQVQLIFFTCKAPSFKRNWDCYSSSRECPIYADRKCKNMHYLLSKKGTRFYQKYLQSTVLSLPVPKHLLCWPYLKVLLRQFAYLEKEVGPTFMTKPAHNVY